MTNQDPCQPLVLASSWAKYLAHLHWFKRDFPTFY